MNTREPQFAARYFSQLLDYLESIGIARRAILRPTGIRVIDDPQGRLTLGQVEALLASAEQHSGRRDLGFELGRLVKTSSHDILGYALLTSSTLGEVFGLLSRYQRLISPVFTLKLERTGSRAELIYRPALQVSPGLMQFHQEAIAVSNHFEFLSLLGGHMPSYDIHFSIQPPAHVKRYTELSPSRVHWGDSTSGLRISVDAILLDRPLAMANPRAMHAAEERCRAMLHMTRSKRRWADWCEMVLREAEECQPTLEQLSGFVNLSSRTLSRYLEAEGVSFRELSLRIRTERASEMLVNSDLPVTQIAYRLGYSDVASFDRSFRQRTGHRPLSFRSSAKLSRSTSRRRSSTKIGLTR
jgi:AraC-like DNA-binding protein